MRFGLAIIASTIWTPQPYGRTSTLDDPIALANAFSGRTPTDVEIEKAREQIAAYAAADRQRLDRTPE
jgi:hypothetical protein